MNEQSRLFDFLYYQHQQFSKQDMLAAKVEGNWVKHSTAEIINTVNKLSAGLLQLGVSGNDMTVENQDKIAIISRNRPEWIMLDLACQQIGVLLVPIYPTTSTNEIEFIFNDASIKYVFISGQELLDKMNSIKNKIPSLINIFSFDELPQVNYWKKLLNNLK